MNKKILITIASIFIVIVLITVIFALISSKQKNAASVDSGTQSYNMTITEYEGTISGSLIKNGVVTQLDELGVSKNAFVSFNTPRDLLWIECPSGYTLATPSSSSKNILSFDADIKAVTMQLVKGQQNNIDFICNKN